MNTTPEHVSSHNLQQCFSKSEWEYLNSLPVFRDRATQLRSVNRFEEVLRFSQELLLQRSSEKESAEIVERDITLNSAHGLHSRKGPVRFRRKRNVYTVYTGSKDSFGTKQLSPFMTVVFDSKGRWIKEMWQISSLLPQLLQKGLEYEVFPRVILYLRDKRPFSPGWG